MASGSGKFAKINKLRASTAASRRRTKRSKAEKSVDWRSAVLTPDKEESECRAGCIRIALQI